MFNVLCFVCVCLCVCTCMWVPSEVRRGCQIPLELHVVMSYLKYMLGTELAPSERAVSALKH